MKAKKQGASFTIGVFSSSSPISKTVPERYERGKAYLESKGHQVINGNLYGKSDFYRSGSPKERAKEFNELLYRDDVDVLMSSIGGNNTNSILPFIDYDYLKKHPKIIVGYSDTTALLSAVHEKTGLIPFYGPALAASFGEFPPLVDETYENFLWMMQGLVPLPYSYTMPLLWTDEMVDWKKQSKAKEGRPNSWITVEGGKATGRLIGGNLNTFEGIFGTEYMWNIREGDLLFIEDSMKDALTEERSFAHLKLAGVFDKIGGIVLGKHELYDDCGSKKPSYELLLEALDGRKIPILADFDCCHTHPMLTLPLGVQMTLDADLQKLTLNESPVQ